MAEPGVKELSTKVTESDVYHGLIYAAQSLEFTYDRVREDDPVARFIHIRDGIIAERAVERILNEQLNITTVSTPLKTDHRSRDAIDVVLLTNQMKLSKADIKSFRPRNHRTRVDDIVRNGWALIPWDQFEKHQEQLYLFAFLLWQDSPSDFIFSSKVVPVAQDEDWPIKELGSLASIGVTSYSPDSGANTQIQNTRNNLFRIAPQPSDGTVFDVVFSFSKEIAKDPLYLTTPKGERFVVSPETWLPAESDRDVGVNLNGANVCLAAWVRGKDVKARWERGRNIREAVNGWDYSPKGDRTHPPYSKTGTDNWKARIRDLHGIAELKALISENRSDPD